VEFSRSFLVGRDGTVLGRFRAPLKTRQRRAQRCDEAALAAWIHQPAAGARPGGGGGQAQHQA